MKKKKKALTESQKYIKNYDLQAIAKIAKIGIWEYQLKNKNFSCSKVMYDIWGKGTTIEALKLECFLERVHPNDLEHFRKNHYYYNDNKKAINLEYKIILQDNSTKWIHERGELITNTVTKQVYWRGIVQDISAYKEKASTWTTTNNDMYQGKPKNLTKYYIKTNAKGIFTYTNEKFFDDFFSLHRGKSIIGTDSLSNLSKIQRNKILVTVKKGIIDPSKICEIKIQISSSVTVLWTFKTLKNAVGEFVGVEGFGIDVVEESSTEKSLHNIIERYNLASKATSDAIWDWDFKTNNLFWGEGFKTLFGHDSGMYPSNKNVWESNIHPEDFDKTVNKINTAIKGKEESWRAEYRFKKANGNYTAVVDRAVILRDQNKKINRIAGAIQDITKKKRLEQLVEKVSTLSRIGCFEIDFNNNKKVYWSPMTRELHEVNEDFKPKLSNIFSFYNPGTALKTLNLFFKNTANKTTELDVNIEITTAKGKIQWIRVLATKEFTHGKINKIFGSIQDIDKITKIEAKILDATQEKEMILESIGDAFFAIDYDGTITYWNKKSEELLELPRSETIHKNILEIFSKYNNYSFYNYYQKSVEEKKSIQFEIYLDAADKWFEVATYCSQQGVSVCFKDITKRKNTNFRLKKINEKLRISTKNLSISNKNFEQFSYIVSHNLRAPLANISGLITLAESNYYTPEIKKNLLLEMKNNVVRLDNVIIDLNAILNLKSTSDLKKEVIELEDLISNLHNELLPTVQNKQLKITTDFNEVPALNTVKAYLHSIFFNLMSNSVKYSKSNGPVEIEIKAEKSEKGLKIIYKDNGIGMDLSKKNYKVFGLYQRFHNHVEGKGMGLFMVKTQVEIIGGKISVMSAIDQGTQFTLDFRKTYIKHI